MTSPLDQFRSQIDSLDDQIMALLKQRCDVVKKVGEFKRETAPGLFPIRPGREASMLRRISGIFKNSGFSPAAAAQIWRIIIGGSTAMEAELTVSVYAPNGEQDCYWLAREYFGPAAGIIKQPHIKRVIGDVLEGTATVGVVPTFSRDDTTGWWANLASPAPGSPKIFAHLPLVLPDEKNTPTALAFAKLKPENSGDDVSVYVMELDHDVSQHRLQTTLAAAKLSGNWIGVANPSPNIRQHLVEIKGFVPPEDTSFKEWLAALGASVQNAHFVGAYGTPFSIKENA